MEVTGLLTQISQPTGILQLGFAAITSSQIVLLALVIGTLTLVMISTRRRLNKIRAEPRFGARERYKNIQRESAARRDTEQVMAELDQLARQIHGRIDTRYAKLEAVIRDADARIEQLSRLVRHAKAEPTIEVTMAAEAPFEPSPDDHGADDRHATIHRLEDGGLNVAQIAQETGKTAGEVELIIALRRTRNAAARPEGGVNTCISPLSGHSSVPSGSDQGQPLASSTASDGLPQ